jgi:hypothetical protein
MFPTFGPDVGGSAFNASLMTILEALYPQSVNASGTGSGCDFNNDTGQCFAIQEVGAIVGGNITGKIQQSADNSTWTDVAGAAFTQVSTGNNVQVNVFTRTQRYLRYNYTVSMAGSMTASCVIAEANQ